MGDDRCRACGAAVAPNAAWCSLCFADLRTPLEPAREPATVAAAPTQPVNAAVVPGPTIDATRAPAVTRPDTAAAPVHLDLADPLGAQPTSVVSPTWPCPRCEQQVPIELDACNACGAGFLAGADIGQALRLPVVGEVTSMSSAQRLLMACGVAVAVTALLVLLAFVGGHLFA